MQYSEIRWISLVDILDVKQPTRMKFQSVSNYVILLYVHWRDILYACNQCLLQGSVSNVANTRVEIILFSL